MASYTELLQAAENSILRNKIRVAIIVAAEKVRTEDIQTANHENRLKWAKKIFENTQHHVDSMVQAVLAQNRAAELNVILNASDEVVQIAVDAAVNVFATGD